MVALERDPGRLDSIELSYVSYGAEPTPELRVEYSGGGLDMFGLRPGTERAIIEWIAERRSG